MKTSTFFWLDRGRGKKSREKRSLDSSSKLSTTLSQKYQSGALSNGGRLTTCWLWWILLEAASLVTAQAGDELWAVSLQECVNQG